MCHGFRSAPTGYPPACHDSVSRIQASQVNTFGYHWLRPLPVGCCVTVPFGVAVSRGTPASYQSVPPNPGRTAHAGARAKADAVAKCFSWECTSRKVGARVVSVAFFGPVDLCFELSAFIPLADSLLCSLTGDQPLVWHLRPLFKVKGGGATGRLVTNGV